MYVCMYACLYAYIYIYTTTLLVEFARGGHGWQSGAAQAVTRLQATGGQWSQPLCRIGLSSFQTRIEIHLISKRNCQNVARIKFFLESGLQVKGEKTD